jgi:hypothetical protein
LHAYSLKHVLIRILTLFLAYYCQADTVYVQVQSAVLATDVVLSWEYNRVLIPKAKLRSLQTTTHAHDAVRNRKRSSLYTDDFRSTFLRCILADLSEVVRCILADRSEVVRCILTDLSEVVRYILADRSEVVRCILADRSEVVVC